MLNKLQNEWRNQLIFVLLILMMIALFTSRAFLSLTMTAFVIVSFIHHDIPGQFRKFFSSPLLWGISLLFFIPLISGLWSADKSQWLDIMRIKLP
jgi:O-antigen ligase